MSEAACAPAGCGGGGGQKGRATVIISTAIAKLRNNGTLHVPAAIPTGSAGSGPRGQQNGCWREGYAPLASTTFLDPRTGLQTAARESGSRRTILDALQVLCKTRGQSTRCLFFFSPRAGVLEYQYKKIHLCLTCQPRSRRELDRLVFHRPSGDISRNQALRLRPNGATICALRDKRLPRRTAPEFAGPADLNFLPRPRH